MALADTLEKKNTANDIIDIELPEIRKKRFRIDKDDNRILELDTSDMSIISRLDDTYAKLQELLKDASEAVGDSDETRGADEIISKTSKTLTSIDNKMRTLIDELFDADVSDVCAPSGSMYDLYNGKYRFEHILEVLFALYEENITKEFEKLKSRVSKHTDKYTNRKAK